MVEAILGAGNYEIKMKRDGSIAATPVGNDISFTLGLWNHQVTFRPNGKYELSATENEVILITDESKYTFTIMPNILAGIPASQNSVRWELDGKDIAVLIGDITTPSALDDIRKTITID